MKMNREQAKELAMRCAEECGWSKEFKREESELEDSWSFWLDEAPPEGEHVERRILVRDDSPEPQAYRLFGEIGTIYRKKSDQLGLPRSDELWLGSGPGKYQLFDRGIVAWDGFTGQASPRLSNYPQYLRGRQVESAVAFFDLRSFTQWAANPNREPADIQKVLEAIESEIQRAVSLELGLQLPRFVFLKGTGDGFMVVVEYPDNPHVVDKFADQFFSACCAVIKGSVPSLPPELSLGCGIDCGNLTQVFLLGQLE